MVGRKGHGVKLSSRWHRKCGSWTFATHSTHFGASLARPLYNHDVELARGMWLDSDRGANGTDATGDQVHAGGQLVLFATSGARNYADGTYTGLRDCDALGDLDG